MLTIDMRRTSVTRLILEKLGELGGVTFDIFFPPQYSFTSFSRTLFGRDSYPEMSPRTLSAVLVRLRNQGLVARSGSRKKSIWSLTKAGKKLLQKSLEEPRSSVIPKKDGIARLVIFDIPERERKKRDILRVGLVSCNFERLQKSVWIGYNPLPEDLIQLIDDLGLQKGVHIFSIRDKGTIR